MRFSLPRTRIATRLFLGLGSLMLLIAGITAFAGHATDSSAAALTDVVRSRGNEALDQRVEKRIADGRSFMWRYLSTGDVSAYEHSREAFAFARDRLKELSARTVAERRPDVVALTETLEAYAVSMDKLQEIKGQNANLDSPDAQSLIADATAVEKRLQQQGDALSTAFAKAAEDTEQSGVTRLSEAGELVIIIGFLSIVLGSAWSVFVARSIAKPVKALTASVRRIAAGDLRGEVPALNRCDEIGEMAKALQIFKENAVDLQQLRHQQEVANEHAAAARRARGIRAKIVA